jgi:hypothetical protein
MNDAALYRFLHEALTPVDESVRALGTVSVLFEQDDLWTSPGARPQRLDLLRTVTRGLLSAVEMLHHRVDILRPDEPPDIKGFDGMQHLLHHTHEQITARNAHG